MGVAALALASMVAACQGCRTTSSQGGGAAPVANDPATEGAPTLRLYVVSDLAGALEPCGCTKDQLGGVDHLAAWVEGQRATAPTSALVSAGPLFFMDDELKPDHAAQDVAKAETIATALRGLGFVAFTPGTNDFVAGGAELAKLEQESGAAMLLPGGVTPFLPDAGGAPPSSAPYVVRKIGGVSVGLVGAYDADPRDPRGAQYDPSGDVKRAVASARDDGAQVVVVLASIGRGEAKRIAEAVPGVTAIAVGSRSASGEANTPAPPAERVDGALIAQGGNHLTSVGVLDLYVRDGSFDFADATGLEAGQKREELTRRIDELRAKIAIWEKDPKVAKGDLDARRADVDRLEKQRAALDARPAPTKGSFFRYTVKEIRDSMGKDPRVEQAMLAYYKQVNDHNKVAFADRLPLPHTPDQPAYVGVAACTGCHEEARKVWDGTKHAHAYETLAKQHKEFNLDCVSCHVTGYDKPGGSTVTHVARLENVQCEVCHGPGSKHAANPKKVAMPTNEPKGEVCLDCHHPPHVAEFDPEKKMNDILGPGHGL